MFLNGNWSSLTFVTDYFPIAFFPILYLAAKYFMGAHTVKAHEMDFVTNVADFDAMTCVPLHCREHHTMFRLETDHENRYDDPPPRNRLEAFWMWLVRTTSSLRLVHVLTMLDVNRIPPDVDTTQCWDSCRLCNFMVKMEDQRGPDRTCQGARARV